MDVLLNALKALGVDKTVFIQFAIFVILFVILKKLFFSKLLEVLKDREEKTVVTEKNSDSLMDEAKELEKKYNEMVAFIYQKYQEKFSEDKTDIMDEENKRFKLHEEQTLQKEEEEIQKIAQEIKALKEAAFQEKDNLKKELITKLS